MRMVQLLPAMNDAGSILPYVAGIDQACRQAQISTCIVVDNQLPSISELEQVVPRKETTDAKEDQQQAAARTRAALAALLGENERTAKREAVSLHVYQQAIPSTRLYDFNRFLREGGVQKDDIILYHLCTPSRLNRIAPVLGNSLVVFYHRLSFHLTDVTDLQYDMITALCRYEAAYVEDLIWQATYCLTENATDESYLYALGCRCPVAIADKNAQENTQDGHWFQEMQQYITQQTMTQKNTEATPLEPLTPEEHLQTLTCQKPGSRQESGQAVDSQGNPDQITSSRHDPQQPAARRSPAKARQNVTNLYRVYKDTLIQNCHMDPDQMMPEHVFVQAQFSDARVCDVSELVKITDKKQFLFEAYWQLLDQAPEEWVVRKRTQDTAPIKTFQQDLLYALLNSSIFQQNDIIAIHNPYEGKISGRQRIKNMLTAIYRHLPLGMRNTIDRLYWKS